MKKARILSSESDASIKIKQNQDTDINLSIAPPAQSVNFQPCAMAELATMAPPSLKPSTFNPIFAEDPILQRSQHLMYPRSSLIQPMTRMQRKHVSAPMDGPYAPASERITVKASQSREEYVKSRDIEDEPSVVPIIQTEPQQIEDPKSEPVKPQSSKSKTEEPKNVTVVSQPERTIEQLPVLEHGEHHFMSLPKLKRTVSRPDAPPVETIQTKPKTIEIDEKIIDGPVIDTNVLPVMVETITSPISVTNIPIIDELKRPMDMNQKSQQQVEQERKHLKEILDEKTKRAGILEAMLGIYESKHQTINNFLTCKQRQLEELVKAYTNATAVELMFENDGGCGCTASGPKIIDVESILVTVGGKSYDFRFGFNDAYADMVRHGINLKQVIA